MNSILKANTKKRKYVRKPLCANLGGICEFNHCRCNYPLIQPETRARIDEYLHHRQRTTKRKKEVNKQKFDSEVTLDGKKLNEIVIEPSGRIDYCCACKKDHGYDCPKDTPRYKGYTPPKKFNYWKIPLIIGLFGLVCLGYVAIISVIDLINL